MFRIEDKITYIHRRTRKEVGSIGEPAGGCLVAIGVLLILSAMWYLFTKPVPNLPRYDPVFLYSMAIVGAALLLLGRRITKGKPSNYAIRHNYTCHLCGKKWTA
jgi:hypothetical protein